MNKRIGQLILILVLFGVAYVAIASPLAVPANSGRTEADLADGGPFRIAIVLPSSTVDMAWSQAFFEALKAVQAEMDDENALEIAYSEGMLQVTDAAAAIRDYASEGYDLIIAHSAHYGNSMFEVAADFPEISFAWGTAVDTGADQGYKNIFAYEAAADEGGYINGVIAALLSQSGIIGVIGPVEAGDAKLYINGFIKGVAETNPAMQVNVSYTGSFGDTALAAAAANVHIQAGADVLTGSAQQVVGAVGIAREAGILWLGTQSDQTSLGPEVVVANHIYDWTGVINDMIAKIRSGELGGTAYKLTLKNGGLIVEFNDNIDIADDVRAATVQAIENIKSGAVQKMK